MTDLVQNLKIGNSAYTIQDGNTLPALTASQRTTLLSNGTYLGNPVETGKIFETSSGKFESFTDTASPPTFSWTAAQLPSSSFWDDITYANGKFVAVSSGPDIAAYSSNGINWTQTTMPAEADWVSVVYGSNMFVSVATNTKNAAYSTDGVNWTASELPSSTSWCDVTYGAGVFVAISQSSNAAYSTDGINWTATTLPNINRGYQSVTYGNGVFVAVPNYRDAVAYSTDGIHWSSTTLPSGGYWWSVTYGGDRFVAVKSNTNSAASAAYSTDGINWTETTLPSSGYWRVTYGDGVFVAVKESSNTAAYSTDGINWTSTTLSASATWYSATYGDGKFVAIAYNSSASSYSSLVVQHTYSLTPLSYTKSEVDTALASKQGTLTAGANITIDSDNVISATGGGDVSLTDIAQAGDNITFTNVPITDYTKIGTDVTVTSNGVASGFNSSSYLQKTGLWNSVGGKNNFIFVTKARITTAGAYYPFIQGSSSVGEDSNQFLIGFDSSSSKIWVEITIGGTAQWANCSLPAINTDFWLKVDYSNSRSRFDIYLSSDGISWGSSVGGVAATGNVDASTAPAFSIGGASALPSSGTAFTGGSIDLSETYVSVDGNIIWRAFEQTNKTSINASVPTVDQTYNALSVNAQSGVAVKSAIDSVYEVVQTLPASPTTGKIYFVTGSTT